ncbi:hypothetical protein RO3G_04887 [Rhizopus delemar RA 99-880]|uniref:Suppressor of forked domain-containing protein n=1 Tax=Rhizopus delemar (strain RA 99-880 / ATCC MYA-4621 / FGSC 9543 / NRRL 43880) TaxID=246409 RepID=I1BVF2_RHIO9|nr:hypothetical protein RO3G_04887 [Rhizopus delemar RA 99-880]|eukprot:EIE80182.1 hypothetical protein RO3G_04887 [Rhizopus delemar RA 99-880]
MSGNTEWERLWQVVRTTPDDFISWEQLVRIAEAAEITPTSPPENITNLELVYDHFLAKFPLCFGYWKKYADWEGIVHGDQGAERTFERGVTAIHNSIDLWNQYIDFKMAKSTNNEEIENLFERASLCIGHDFLAHPFWDKYIDFIANQLADTKKLLKLMDRIVLIPMHQYARYYEKWREIRANTKPSEAVDDLTLKTFYAEIQEEKGNLTNEALELALREKLDAQTAKVYKETQEGTNKRWVYEAEIKRSYFHIRPLDRLQLQNWTKYLDFEEAANDTARIKALYERCLVPCAQYEEFWLRYGQWLIKNDLVAEAQSAYTRAAYTFLKSDKIHVKLALALVLEQEEKIDEARSTYTSILTTMPSHIESITHYIYFERRQNVDSFENIIQQYINSDYFDLPARVLFTIQYIKHLQQVWYYQHKQVFLDELYQF